MSTFIGHDQQPEHQMYQHRSTQLPSNRSNYQQPSARSSGQTTPTLASPEFTPTSTRPQSVSGESSEQECEDTNHPKCWTCQCKSKSNTNPISGPTGITYNQRQIATILSKARQRFFAAKKATKSVASQAIIEQASSEITQVFEHSELPYKHFVTNDGFGLPKWGPEKYNHLLPELLTSANGFYPTTEGAYKATCAPDGTAKIGMETMHARLDICRQGDTQ